MMLRSGRRAGEGDSPEIKKNIANGQMDASSTVNIVGRKVNYVILLAHFNIFLYALCFWIQNGTLPVRLNNNNNNNNNDNNNNNNNNNN